jgi:hypothetical protein
MALLCGLSKRGVTGKWLARRLGSPFGIVRDVSVRVPAGTALLRSVGILAAAGIAVVETALEAPEVTVTVEGVGMATKEVFLKAKQLPC